MPVDTYVYARNTEVSAEKSATEIRRMVERNGGRWIGNYHFEEAQGCKFKIDGINVEIKVPVAIDMDERRKPEQIIRERWRLAVLKVKSRLATIAAGGDVVEEFLSYIETDSGATVGDVIVPMMREALRQGRSHLQLALPDVIEGELVR